MAVWTRPGKGNDARPEGSTATRVQFPAGSHLRPSLQPVLRRLLRARDTTCYRRRRQWSLRCSKCHQKNMEERVAYVLWKPTRGIHFLQDAAGHEPDKAAVWGPKWLCGSVGSRELLLTRAKRSVERTRRFFPLTSTRRTRSGGRQAKPRYLMDWASAGRIPGIGMDSYLAQARRADTPLRPVQARLHTRHRKAPRRSAHEKREPVPPSEPTSRPTPMTTHRAQRPDRPLIETARRDSSRRTDRQFAPAAGGMWRSTAGRSGGSFIRIAPIVSAVVSPRNAR